MYFVAESVKHLLIPNVDPTGSNRERILCCLFVVTLPMEFTVSIYCYALIPSSWSAVIEIRSDFSMNREQLTSPQTVWSVQDKESRKEQHFYFLLEKERPLYSSFACHSHKLGNRISRESNWSLWFY